MQENDSKRVPESCEARVGLRFETDSRQIRDRFETDSGRREEKRGLPALHLRQDGPGFGQRRVVRVQNELEDAIYSMTRKWYDQKVVLDACTSRQHGIASRPYTSSLVMRAHNHTNPLTPLTHTDT